MRGRPNKLTPKRQEKIVDALATGNTRTTSVAYAGIDYQTFLNWLARGKIAKKGIYFDFFDAVKKAEAAAEVDNVATIKRQSASNWTAAAWWLERRRPDDWKKVEGREIVGGGGGPIQLQWADDATATDTPTETDTWTVEEEEPGSP